MNNIIRTLNGMALAAMALFAAACSGENKGGYVGYIEAEYVYVAPPEAGWLVAMDVREGDEAAIGQTLFELDKTRQEAAFEAAAARAVEADAMAQNIETGARPEEVQRLKAQLAESEAALRLARAERDRWLPLVAEGMPQKPKATR